MLTALALAACIGAGTIGGVFFAFSSFVMQALAELPAAQGIAAMQRINVVVLNPLFLAVFVGTAALSIGAAILAFLAWASPGSPLLVTACLLYVVGSFAVTISFNVPRNERLARLDPTSAETAAYWPVFVREWSQWNHVRTVASLASAAFSGMALNA